MEQLKIGRISSKELADWFGISYDTYRRSKTKKKKLEELKTFCDYEEVYGGVQVKEIYQDRYKGNLPSDKEVFVTYLYECNEFLSTLAGMTRKVEKDNVSAYKGLAESTIKRRLRNQNNLLFGTMPKKGTKGLEVEGQLGSRKYVYAVKIDDYNHYRHLTEEERDIFFTIMKAVCGDKADKIACLMLLEAEFEETEMTKEEFLERKDAIEGLGGNLFQSVVSEFLEKTGNILARVTEYQINAFMMEEIEKLRARASAVGLK